MDNEDVRQEQQLNVHEVATDFDPLSATKESTESHDLISTERVPSPRKVRRPRKNTSLQAENLITLSPNANLLLEAGISISSTTEEEKRRYAWWPSPPSDTPDQTAQEEKSQKEDSKSHPAIARKIITGEKKENGGNKKLFGLTLSKTARTTLINETYKRRENLTGKPLII